MRHDKTDGSGPPLALDVEERTRLMRDSVYNNLGILLPGVVGIILVPFLLRGLGSESYGLWLAALAVASTIGCLDLGLSWSMTREVAGTLDTSISDEASRFAATVGRAYLTLSVAGALVIGSLGLLLTPALHLSPPNSAIAPLVFVLVGIAFVGDTLMVWAAALLYGLRRYDLTSMIAVVAALLRAAGILALLAAGAGLLAIAAWHVLATSVAAILAHRIVRRVAPQFGLSLGRLDWSLLRTHMPFSVASQMISGAVKVTWETAPIIIGVVLGSAHIVPYHIGQKFPLAVSGLAWRAADVSFPAASQHERAGDMGRTSGLLEVGTRWITLLVTPLCAVLFIVAPNLLQVWIGNADPETVLVLRLTTLAVFADALGVTALHLLWGRGAARTAFLILSAVAVATLSLGLWLLIRIGIAGMALALVLSITAGSLALLQLAVRTCGLSLPGLAKTVFRGLLLPAVTCTVVAYALIRLFPPGSMAGLVVTCVAAGLIYALGVHVWGARKEERVFARELLVLPATLTRSVYRALRHTLGRVEVLRSGYSLLLVAKVFLQDSPQRARAGFERKFRQQTDPWNYNSPEGGERLRRALEILDRARGERRFPQALEIGCAEGTFTEMLASRCDSLLAVDISPTALDRARTRCNAVSHVRFAEWDLRRDTPTDVFDLVVVMDVLTYFARLSALREARDKLVAAARPGGYLLVANPRQAEIFEVAWWGRHLLRGGKWINAFIAEHHDLRLVTAVTDKSSVYTLLRKVS